MEKPTPPQDIEALLAEDPYLRTLAKTLLEGEADDLVQQTYLRAIQDQEIRVRTPRRWLTKILRNLASNMRRVRDRSRDREARAAARDLVPSSTELMEWEEQRRSLVRAVDGLDEVHRTVVLLRYFDGLAPRVIAKRLELPVGTVWNRLRRGLVLLRQRLDAEHDGDRRAWALPLISLATHGLAFPGAFIMGTKLKMAAIAAVLITFVGGVVWSLEGTAEVEATDQPMVLEPIALAESVVEDEVVTIPEAAPNRLLLAAEELAATTGTLNLTVVYGDDKSPAAALGLDLYEASSRDALNPRLRIRTDDAGQTTVEGLAPGRYFLWPDLKSNFGEAEIFAGEETELLFELAQGVDIEGIVVDQAQRPVPAAEISLAMFAMVGDVSQVVTRTGADGRFSIRAAAEFCPVSARAQGFASSEAYMVAAEEGAQIEMRIMLIAPGGRIHGRVLDPEGEPVAGARIRIGTDGINSFVTMLPGGVRGMPRRATEVHSDAEGCFEVHGMPLGANAINLRAAGLAPWSGEVQVEAHPSAEILIQLLPGVELSGEIHNPNGDPIAGVSVQVGDVLKIAYYHTRTAADGSYHIEGLPSGEFEIRAGDEERGLANATLSGGPGESLIWNAELSHGLELRGMILDREGNPVEHASLTVSSAEENIGSKLWMRHASSDREGRFILPNCPEDHDLKLRVEVKGRLVAERTSIDPRDGEVVIRLEVDITPSVHIRGIAVDHQGRPLGNAVLRVERRSYNTDSLTGAFDLGPLVPGKFKLRINPDGHPRFVSEERELFANEVWDLGIIQIPAGGTLHARLGYWGDGPRLRAFLQVQAVAGGEFYAGYSATDSHSQVLVPGMYRLAVRGAGVADQSIPFEVQVGEITQLEIEIEPGLRRDFGIDLPPDAQADQQVELTITGADGVVLRTTVRPRQSGDYETHATFTPGTYTLDAVSAGGLKGSQQFTVEAGQETVPRIRISLHR